MRHLAAASAVVAVSASVSAAPAHAAPARVVVSYAVHGMTIGGGDLVVAYCEATAEPGTTGGAAAFTTITCGVNGASDSRTTPGGKSVVTSVNATVPPYVLCYSASATFTGAAGTVTSGPTCVAL